MTRAITAFLEHWGVALPPWAAPATVLVLAICLLPFILRNFRTSRARRLIRRAWLEGGPERQATEAEALALVGDHPMGLVAVAEEAIRKGRLGLAREALLLLKGTGKQRQHLRRLTHELEGKPPGSVHEIEVVVDQLLAEGMAGEALRRVQRARVRFPDSSELDALDARIQGQLAARAEA